MQRLRLLVALVLLAGCLPGKGEVTLFGDAALAADKGTQPAADGTATGERGSGPSEAAPPLPDGAPKPDALKPDAKASTPQPPFGSSVGMTAQNFTGIPDCSGKLYNLHDYYNKTKGVVLAMMSPS